jgi:hypothetical protein
MVADAAGVISKLARCFPDMVFHKLGADGHRAGLRFGLIFARGRPRRQALQFVNRIGLARSVLPLGTQAKGGDQETGSQGGEESHSRSQN